MPVAVVGIGHSMRGDDAAGLEAVRLWQRSYTRTAQRPDVRVAMIEGPGLDLLDVLDGAEGAVLVDAVCSEAVSGTVHRTGPQAMTGHRDTASATHGWGVGEVLRLAQSISPQSGRMAIRLVGIEASGMELGEGLSDPVRAALPSASEAIELEVGALLRE